MKTANDILLKALGDLLIVAGGLKGWQLITEQVAIRDAFVAYGG